MIFFPNILRCSVQRKKTKNKTTINPTIFSDHHKSNKAQQSPPPATTNHHKPAKSHHKFNKKNHQTHHQPPQTHKKTINPQIITTYNHSKTHSQSKPRTIKLHISKPTNHYNRESTARIVTTELLNSKECGGEINDGCGVQISDGGV